MTCYNRFALERAGLYDYAIWVKGDDTVIFINSMHKDAALQAISKVFLTEQMYNKQQGIVYGLVS